MVSTNGGVMSNSNLVSKVCILLKEADMLVAKMNLLMKRIEDCEKMSVQEGVQAMDVV